jgi:hypothetical protein
VLAQGGNATREALWKEMFDLMQPQGYFYKGMVKALSLTIYTAPTTFYTFFYKNLKKIISKMVIRILVSISEFVFF